MTLSQIYPLGSPFLCTCSDRSLRTSFPFWYKIFETPFVLSLPSLRTSHFQSSVPFLESGFRPQNARGCCASGGGIIAFMYVFVTSEIKLRVSCAPEKPSATKLHHQSLFHCLWTFPGDWSSCSSWQDGLADRGTSP